jgi:hypothetical protein
MAFISVIDATTGTRVAVGADSAQAYQAISGGAPVTLGLAEREEKLKSIFTSNGYSLISPTSISPDVQIQVNNFTYLNEQQWPTANSSVNGFVTDYCQKYQVSEVYYWRGADNSLSFGILVSASGIVKLYYITVQNR